MKNASFKFIKTQLSCDEMQFVAAGSSGAPEKHIQEADPHRTSGRKPPFLAQAYRRLSRRECEVLEKIAEGKANHEIADELFIAKGTVENHITRIGKALGVQGRGSVRQWVDRQKYHE